MISISRKKTKTVVLIFLILIVLVLLGLTFYYSGYIEVFRNFVKGQKTEKDIIDGISINNIELNYDTKSNTYYLPINLEENKEIKLDIKINSDYNIDSNIEDKKFKKKIEIYDSINYNKVYQLDVETWLYTKSYKIMFTNLPSISLNFNERNIGFEYIYSEFSITDPNYKENDSKYQYFDDAEVRYRGDSTAGYQKKSYRIKLEKNIDFGFLGMAISKTWILDSLVTDSSCLRTKLASDIWNRMNKDLSEEKYANLNSEFVELYVNDEYAGIYLLKETVDEELLNLDDDGILIKGVNWNQIDFNNYGNIERETFGPFEMKYPDSAQKYPDAWRSILDKLKEYYSGYTSFEVMDKTFYKENIVNHKIFILITQALDNYEYKNVYYSIKKDDEDAKVLITPWDLDLTFGMLWNEEILNYTEQYDRVEEIVSPFGTVSDGKTSELYKERWEYLSKTVLDKAEINELADKQYEYLTKANALQRENIKNKNNIDLEAEKEEIKDWYDKRFDAIDVYIESL